MPLPLMNEKFWAVVPAAGAGKRMSSAIPKQYLSLHGHQVIEHTVSRLLSHQKITAVCLALSPEDEWWSFTSFAEDERVLRVTGGQERCHSVLNALKFLQEIASEEDWVLLHDAARPCLRHGDLEHLISELQQDSVGGLLGIPVHDTVKKVDLSGRVEATLPRDPLWRAFTPQMFRLGPLRKALQNALSQGYLVTDEASAMELAGHRPKMVEGHPDNIKITKPGDLALAEFYLKQQSSAG
jgi:2-C-methyl-D-erythritol 4-phosphate cytidylyltransferase